MGLTTLLALLPLLSSATAETVLGLYVFHRHGDRTSKEWPPTSLTALGADQVFVSGSYYRNRYIAANSTSQIHSVSANTAVLSQLSVTSPSDNVLQVSANVFTQGLYPPAGEASAQKLANGTNVEAPLGGYQYIPVNAVATASSAGGSEDSGWLQGGSGCGNAVVSSNQYFSSPEFLDTLARTNDFYQNLLPVINTTFSSSQAAFKNAYTIYDYIHVSEIHNATIPSSGLLTDDVLHQVQTLADQHEWGLAYNASSPIRAIAGSVLAAQALDFLNATLSAPLAKSSAQRVGIQFGAYASFMSFFGLAQLPAASPDFYGIVDYASSIAFELVTNASVTGTTTTTVISPADVSVRFLFANGSASDANPLTPFALFGQPETLLPWANFSSAMGKIAVGTTEEWCHACGNTTGTCAQYASSSSSSGSSGSSGSGGSASGSSSASHDGGSGVSRPVAGVIGALVTLVVILGVEGLVMAIAGLRLVKKRAQGSGAAATASGASGVKA